jgi:PAS domain S-box-containing protein
MAQLYMIDSCPDPEPFSAPKRCVLERYSLLSHPLVPELEHILQRAQRGCSIEHASLYLLDTQGLWLAAGKGPQALSQGQGFWFEVLTATTIVEINTATGESEALPVALSEVLPGIRFYAGLALRTSEGIPLGFLSLMDTSPRRLDETQRFLIEELAHSAMAQLELHAMQVERDKVCLHAQRSLSDKDTASPRQHILDSAVDYAIFCMDLEGRITTWNEGAFRTLGWTESEALGQLGAMIFTPEDRAAHVPDHEQQTALSKGRSMDERWHLRRGGQRFWASGELMPLKDESGKVTGYIKILRDRTEQRLAGEALRASHDNYRLLLDSISDGFYSIDLNGIVTLCNAAFVKMFGVSHPQEIIGRRLETLIEPTHVQARQAMMDLPIYRAMRDGTAEYVADGAFYQHDGFCLPVEYRAQAIYQNGEIQGALCTVTDNSEQVRAFEGWRRTMRIVEQSDDFISMASLDGRVYFVNKSGRNLVGIADMDAVQQSAVLDYFVPEDRHFVEFTVLPCVMKEGKWTGELRFRDRRTEQAIPVHYSIFTTRDEKGEVVGIAGIARSMSEQKHAQKRIEESETRLRQLTDLSPAIIWFGNTDGSLSYLNSYWYDYTGQTPEEALPMGWAQAVHPDDTQRLMDVWLDARTRGVFYELEARLRRQDGTYRWFHIRAQVLRDDAGNVTGWMGNNSDIHDRKEAEEASQRLTETLEQRVAERTADLDRMWRLTTDVMLVARFDGVMVAANPAWHHLLGWAEDELLGNVLLDFVHPDDVDSTLAEVGKLSRGYTTLRFENRYRHKDGSYRWLSWTAVPDAQYIHAVGRDIESEKAAAAELALAQEQLRQAQKMEAVGQLTGGIAHDFNNLLTGIIGSLDLIRMRIQQGKLADLDRFASTAMSSANRAAALTHRLLAFSRRQPLDPKVVNANELVTGMDDLLHRTMGEDVKLEIVRSGGLWLTLCDPHQLENAILNLAINARAAMPEGGRLTIETSNTYLDEAYAARDRDVRPGQYVCVSVTDTGTGMTADVIAKAFDPFFTTKPLGEGTGLGLSMIYGFARQSEGAAKIYSEVGKGTTIKLYLPRYYGNIQEDVRSTHPVSLNRQSEASEVVLVVEDEHAVRSLVVEVLSELGYWVLEAVDGPAGLEVLDSDLRIDLLVTDVGLPGLNGRQMADAARLKRPDLKVLFMTGYAENAVIANGFLEPGMAMITKPFPIDVLAMRVQDMVQKG